MPLKNPLKNNMGNVNDSGNSGVSIIICCYNSAKRLPATIKHIAKQETKADLNFEVLIINNASKDNTAELANIECGRQFINIPYKIIDEQTPGKSNAVNKGVKESKYEFIIFCDDDNWLAPDYIQTAYDIMKNNSSIGVLGNQTIGEYEITPPAWFLDNLKSFAIGKQGEKSGDITNKKGAVWGAGSIVRKSNFLILQRNGFEFVLTDRKGDQLSVGGDTELCLAIKSLGFKIYYEEKLQAKHFMSESRFSFNNFLKQTYQNGKVLFVYDAYKGKVKNYLFYLLTKTFTVSIKLLTVFIICSFYKLIGNRSVDRYRSERRIYYFLGVLHTLLNFSYCRNALSMIRKNLMIGFNNSVKVA